MLDGIKNKLGFAKDDDYDEYYDNYDDYSDDYDDSAAQDGGDADQDDSYSSYAPVTTRTAGTNRQRRTSYRAAAASSFDAQRGAESHPRLVSMDDVRASTQVPDRLNRDPLPPRRSYSSGFATRNVVGHANDYARSGSESDLGYGAPAEDVPAASDSTSASRSPGLDSLFSESSVPAKPASAVGVGVRPAASSGSSRSYDPYDAYEGAGASAHKPTRELRVLTPVSYGEVEEVARCLKAGDAVVLSLRNTQNQLAKRILDFAFGVASALDGSVDCAADKVFVITRGKGLSEQETMQLHNQGVL